MSKSIFFIMCCALLIGVVPVYAAPSGGTCPVIDGSLVSLALEYDYVFDREIKSSYVTNGKIKEASTVYLKLSTKPADFLFLYATAGGTNFHIKSDLTNGNTLTEKYKMGFFTGGGVKLIYEVIPNLKFALDNQLNWWRSDIDDVIYDQAITDKSGHRSAWEYQLSGIFSYTIKWDSVVHPVNGEWPAVTPYIGVKYSYLKMDNNITIKTSTGTVPAPDNIRNDNKAGLILGADIDLSSLGGFMFNLEARLLDENAISGAISYNF
jgi:hypothetical protein